MTAMSDAAADRPLFLAELRPAAAMSPRGFRIMMGVSAVVLCILSLGFFLAGAWPVAGFFGLDLALLYLAFRVSYKRAKAREILEFRPDEVTLTRRSPQGVTYTDRFQPYWLRAVLEEAPAQGKILTLRSHGRAVEIGRFLAPGEKESLAEKLNEELSRLKTLQG